MSWNIGKILKTAFPYLAVLLLWRLSASFWNPGGILALIPIFYYSFIKPIRKFSLFAVIFCFLIDYKFDSLLFWTSFYCLFYAINGFQSVIDLTRQKNDGIFVFMMYFGISSILLAIIGFSFIGFVHALWLFLWMAILYIPFVIIAKRITNDR